MPNILVTGAGGFIGSALLADFASEPSNHLIKVMRQVDGNCNVSCDLRDAKAVQALLELTKPEQIYHLAGSFANQYDDDYQSNVVTTKNILDGVLALNLHCRILLVGSAAEYGVAEDSPVQESSPLQPVSIYGLTKAMQTSLMQYYVRVFDMDVVMARTFNLLGRGQSEKLFMGTLYKQIDKYKRGDISKIVLGNLNSKRDYISVKRAIAYFKSIMQGGKSGEVYNVGSGQSQSMQKLLNKILIGEGVPADSVTSEGLRAQSKPVNDIVASLDKTMSLIHTSSDGGIKKTS